jgi:dihydrofolate reductase
MIISLVVAASENNAIGLNNALLWKLPNDMKFFKNLTWGMPVIMGRKTFASMASRPLPGRINIVISRNPNALPIMENVWPASSLENALALAHSSDCREAFVIGGGDIYKQCITMADRIYMTRVHASYPDADTFFPTIDETLFRIENAVDMPSDEKHAQSYRFETWHRLEDTKA